MLDNFDRMILEGEQGSKSLGSDSLLNVSEAELIDSNKMYDDYLNSLNNKLDKEDGQMLVYTENTGFKIINIPQSLLLWARKKQEKTVCLIKPNVSLLLQDTVHTIVDQQAEDLYKLAILNLLMDSILWMVKHSKLGCKYCNRTAELHVMPALYHCLKSSRIGQKGLTFEEVYMSKRIADVVRLPNNLEKTHDIMVPRKLIRGLIQHLHKQPELISRGEPLTETEYQRNFANCIGIKQKGLGIEFSNAVLIASILAKNNPGARE